MKVFILVVLATVCIVGLSKAAPFNLKEDIALGIALHSLRQALRSGGMVEEAAAKQENTQLQQRKGDNAKEEWCVCIRSPCPCARPGERGNRLRQEQQENALVQEEFLSAIAEYLLQQKMN